MHMADIAALLQRSEELENAIFGILDPDTFGLGELDLRLDAGIRLAGVSLEHGGALRELVGAGLFPSAVTLMRPQFEALARAAWAVWAAKDADVDRLQAPLTLMTEKEARKLTGLSEMLTQLEGRAPAGLVQMLNVFKDTSLTALNSFVHGGIHVLTRHASGYPEHLVAQVVRNSNGLLTMAGMLLTLLGADDDARTRMRKIQTRFADCLPPLLPQKTAS
jgi:hypothetical protein